MWEWTLNWNEVTEQLIIGSCPRTLRDLEKIRTESRATALLCLQNQSCFDYWDIDYLAMRKKGSELGLTMAHSPMGDMDIHEQRYSLAPAVRELTKLQREGHRSYVHCTAGLGRAPLTVLAYLSLVEGHGPEKAIAMIKKARPEAVPSWEAYHGCLKDLTDQHRAKVEKRAYFVHRKEKTNRPKEDWAQAQIEVLGTLLVPQH